MHKTRPTRHLPSSSPRCTRRTTHTMSMLDRFRKGAEKAGMQATAFLNTTGTKVASESRRFAQEFTLPGEAEKAANILQSFLGE